MDLFTGRPVLVGMPLSMSHQSDTRVISLLEMWDRRKDVETYYVTSSSAALGRDRIVMYARHRVPKPSHILFVDSDVLPRPSTLKKLLAHNKDVVSGVYPMMQNCRLSWCLSREEPFKGLGITELPDNPFKTKFVGCGMRLVKMEVFDNLKWPYWKDVFAPGRKLVSEDLFFCQILRKFGYDIWVDPKIKCNHFKTVDLLGVAMNYNLKGKQK